MAEINISTENNITRIITQHNFIFIINCDSLKFDDIKAKTDVLTALTFNTTYDSETNKIYAVLNLKEVK